MFYYDVIGVFGQSLAWSWLLDFLNGTYDFKLQIMSIMFYRCTWYPFIHGHHLSNWHNKIW